MKKHFIILLAMLSVLLLVPMSASAASSAAKIGATDYATLQEAINAAAAGQTVVLNADVTENISIPNKTFTLDLNGHVLAGTGTSSVIVMTDGGTLTLTDSNPDAVHKFAVNADTGLWSLDEANGTKTVKGGIITGGIGYPASGNTSTYAGGIYIKASTFIMNGGNVVGNVCSVRGGGIFGGSGSSISVNAGSLQGNVALAGGGIASGGSATVNGGLIAGNTATAFGGGIYGKCNLYGGTITENIAPKGAGLFLADGDRKLGGEVRITGNKDTDGNASNVSGANSAFTFSVDAQNPLTGNASIGIGGRYGAFCLNMTQAVYDGGFFFSDTADYTIKFDSSASELYLKVAAVITITTDDANKSYDGTPLTCSDFTYTDGILSSNETLDVTVNGSITNAGTADNTLDSYTVTYKKGTASAANVTKYFTFGTPTLGTLTVSPAQLFIFGTTVADKVYDGSTNAVITEGELTGVISGDDVSVSAFGSFCDAQAGEDKDVEITYVISGEDADNYMTPEGETGYATIEKRSLTVTPDDDQTKVYDGTTASGITYTASNAAGEEIPAFTGALEIINNGTDAATYYIVLGTLAMTDNNDFNAANYEIDFTDSISYVITPKAVTVTADDKTKTEGASDPEFTATVVGTLGTDTVSYTFDREVGEEPGEYAISPIGDTEQGNYTVTFVDGTLTVEAAPAGGEADNTVLLLLCAFAAVTLIAVTARKRVNG